MRSKALPLGEYWGETWGPSCAPGAEMQCYRRRLPLDPRLLLLRHVKSDGLFHHPHSVLLNVEPPVVCLPGHQGESGAFLIPSTTSSFNIIRFHLVIWPLPAKSF